jgi:ATP synthase protein I
MNDDDNDGSRRGTEATSFDARLRFARERQGLEPKAAEPGQGSHAEANASAMRIGLRVGVELVSALVLGVAIGYGLDRLLGTRPVFIAVFVLLGGAAGIVNVWRVFAPKRDEARPARTKGTI